MSDESDLELRHLILEDCNKLKFNALIKNFNYSR
jgi:hypothetical protein